MATNFKSIMSQTHIESSEMKLNHLMKGANSEMFCLMEHAWCEFLRHVALVQ